MIKPNVKDKCYQHLYTLGIIIFWYSWDEPNASDTLMALLVYVYIVAYVRKKYYLYRLLYRHLWRYATWWRYWLNRIKGNEQHIPSQTVLRNVCSGTCCSFLCFVYLVSKSPPQRLLRLPAYLWEKGYL